ncbi:XXYS1_4_G0044820.mRNA.1.CDS.1 [Saccharomyces cerevisiae]|nr:XXYS1_4_G0044820.mRNA.1.CDS.1 [Saccharomyces cerevisiae]CAD6608601.1 EM14S01-3B_G0042250.mRNA.1.CDS.1 [Saccharomyces cerevisiae]CAI4319130.1 AMH_1a_G0007920.mRNA.1.CDS.1 [Saccharomyces cerevisiae]CAI4328411.1 CEI_1a_G0007870.mRNA.1.CDS.1 [Saccharomyces cerevisiae]CAI6539604.1 AMH_1a_G0007920.mRNA.1.CDS.1 [Saccharomyces cerevisiae]
MARGNQRDLARQKNLKKQKDMAKNQKKSGDPKKRMESDAEILRQKQAAADARREVEKLEKLKAEKTRR